MLVRWKGEEGDTKQSKALVIYCIFKETTGKAHGRVTACSGAGFVSIFK